ncbi:uncharacterized protein LOC113470811 [Diaphorina citri]|uniref:Uncharacterized protein LOC113470811 n=1 Tax=Diaphorina citri TaxID=121845 RepID=A0A3Q0JA83_DIACI|nr:uncharacterized protein LOC113470811 [Diaphorina citri]
MVTDNRVIVNQMFSILRWNLQLISEPGPDSVLHLCRLYPALESPLSPKEEYDPRLICDYGPVQAVPPVIMTQWFDHIESDTKFDRLKFSITTWPGNIVTLRFALDSTDYSVTLNIIKRGGGGGAGGGGRGEECGDGMRSCVSFVMEEETLEIDEHDRIILSQRSTTGEVTVASIVTTHQTCNYNDELVLEGTVEIAFNPAAETPNEELLNAKVELIKSYLTHDESDYSER